MYRNRYKGTDYIEKFPKFKKWINECRCCHKEGYAPDMPEHIGGEYSMAAGQIRKKLFSPLIINSDGLCEVCEKLNKKG